jgi:hypothetical protein
VVGAVANTGRAAISGFSSGKTRTAAATPAPEADDYCGKPVGNWSMGGFHSKGNVSIGSNHTMLLWGRNGMTTATGNWNCDATSRRINLAWANGAIDTVAMTSAKNSVMQGADQHAHRVVYKRTR